MFSWKGLDLNYFKAIGTKAVTLADSIAELYQCYPLVTRTCESTSAWSVFSFQERTATTVQGTTSLGDAGTFGKTEILESDVC